MWRRQLESTSTNVPSQPSPSLSEASTEIPQWNRPGHVRATNSDLSSHMMDDILSPDSGAADHYFDDDDANLSYFSDHSLSHSEPSADSIIQRVEEEIAAARLAAAHAKNRRLESTKAIESSLSPRRRYDYHNDKGWDASLSVLESQRAANIVGEEFENEFNSVRRDDQISLFSGDDFSSFDYFADEFKDSIDPVQTEQTQSQHHMDDASVHTNLLSYDCNRTPRMRHPLSPATTVDTVPARNVIAKTHSWESFDTRREQENESIMSVLSPPVGVDEKDDVASIHEAPSIGTSLGGTRNAQRARAILDTLKERRETFKTVFLTSNTLTKNQPSQQPISLEPTINEEILDEKKEDESPLAPWNAPVIEKLPVPIKKKVQKPEVQPELNLEMKAEAKVKEVEETINRKSRRIRFRDAFPVIKPPSRPRAAEDIIAEHNLGTPDFPIRWVRPKNNLKQLIVAAMGNSLIRRSNACGALKVLTAEKKNQLTLARTDSFLDALVFAASQEIPKGSEHELALTARTRAISCLKNVCGPKDNRVHVLMHAGVLECLSRVIRDDRGEARMISCMALALLAKSPECREPMAGTNGLLALLGIVLKGELDLEESLESRTSLESTDVSQQMKARNCSDHSASGSDSEYSGRSQSRDGDDDTHSRDSDEGSLSSDNSTSSETTSNRMTSGDDESKREHMSMEKTKQKILSEKNSVFLHKSRLNACAVLVHLSKHCAVLSQLCSDSTLVDALVLVTKEADNPLHTKCLEILCNLSRFPPNTSFMTRYTGLVDALVVASDSSIGADRIFALRSLQNMSADSSSKSLLATESVLSKMTLCALRNNLEEKEAAVAFLYNVSTEPGAVVAITNTKNVVATLVHLAHHPESTSDIRLMACDALATISLWLQTLAGTGRVPKDMPNIPLPSHKTTGWNRWD